MQGSPRFNQRKCFFWAIDKNIFSVEELELKMQELKTTKTKNALTAVYQYCTKQMQTNHKAVYDKLIQEELARRVAFKNGVAVANKAAKANAKEARVAAKEAKREEAMRQREKAMQAVQAARSALPKKSKCVS